MKLRFLFIILTTLITFITAPARAVDYSCQRLPEALGDEPTWSTSDKTDLKFVVSWAFKDPEKCIVGMETPSEVSGSGYFHWNFAEYFTKYQFPAKWTISRDGDMALVSAETEFPIELLLSLPNRNLDGLSLDFDQISQKYEMTDAWIKVKRTGAFDHLLIRGSYGLPQLWGNWFSKNQGLANRDCKPIAPDFFGQVNVKYKLDYKVISAGQKPTVEISIDEPSNCLFLVYAGPLEKVKSLAKYGSGGYLAEHPFWSGEAPTYFDSILKFPNEVLRMGTGNFIGQRSDSFYGDESILGITSLPEQNLSHFDTVRIEGNRVLITSTLDGSPISPNNNGYLTVYIGFYNWYSKSSSYFPAGWRISYSRNSWSANYYSGATFPGGLFMKYTTDAIKIPISDLFLSSEEKSKAKAKEEERIAEAVQKENEIRNAEALKRVEELKAKNETKYPNEINSKLRVTITCAKGSILKKFTSFNPKCPTGYKLQKVKK